MTIGIWQMGKGVVNYSFVWGVGGGGGWGSGIKVVLLRFGLLSLVL